MRYNPTVSNPASLDGCSMKYHSGNFCPDILAHGSLHTSVGFILWGTLKEGTDCTHEATEEWGAIMMLWEDQLEMLSHRKKRMNVWVKHNSILHHKIMKRIMINSLHEIAGSLWCKSLTFWAIFSGDDRVKRIRPGGEEPFR